jgi:putative ABC transport system permease protein
LSYLVEQRTREIGVRMALGASSRQVTRLMPAQTTRPVMYGLIAGAGLAAALAAPVIATPVGAYISQIVHVTDPVAYASSLLVIIAACLLAAWIPAARARSTRCAHCGRNSRPGDQHPASQSRRHRELGWL